LATKPQAVPSPKGRGSDPVLVTGADELKYSKCLG
jgi:hypothetical protein